MKAIDMAGNESETTSVEVTTKLVAESSKTTIGIRYSETESTPDPVTVYFTNNSDDDSLIIKYQIGNTDGEWLDYDDTKGVTVEDNTDIYARLFDVIGQSSDTTAVANVTNIYYVPKVGDFVNYDAGTWNSSTDTAKITSSGGSVSWSSSKPTIQGQFGGFIDGGDRNGNSTPYNTNWTPDYEGWRVWSVDEDVVTLISAGHTETYYHGDASIAYSNASINILRNRDYSMYLNRHSYATKAWILTGEDAVEWYNYHFDSDYTLVNYGGNSTSTWYSTVLPTTSPIDVLENCSYYWFATAYNSSRLYCVRPTSRDVSSRDISGGGGAYRCSCFNFSIF